MCRSKNLGCGQANTRSLAQAESKTQPANTPKNCVSNGLPNSPTRQTSTNNGARYSLASAGRYHRSDTSHSSGSFDFLPSVNFDDLHSSIFSDAPDIDSFPAPGGSTFKQLDSPVGLSGLSVRPGLKGHSKTADASELGTRIGLNGSSIRYHKSGEQRSGQMSQEVEFPNVSATSASARGRKSYFLSGSTSMQGSRAPRKSVGPGILTSGFELHDISQRPSLAQAGVGSANDAAAGGSEHLSGLHTTHFESSRYQKAKSFQATLRKSQDAPLTPNVTLGEFDFSMGSHNRSPGRSNFQRTITPSSSKRLSIMPNSVHATGLAARTISPTDARRLKRMSMMPNPHSIPHTPPTPQPETPSSAGLPSAPSPSMILPRTSVTPSSSRTTPDPNRKSYSSGISNSSNTSYNSALASSGTARMPPSFSSSRLPTPKSRGENLTGGDQEIVPPVPAIPKAYESPKEEINQPFFSKRKSILACDVNSLSGISTASGVLTQQDDISTKATQNLTRLKPQHQPVEPATERKPNNKNRNQRTLQPLRLPPLNLLPLSTPTATKIAALYDGSTAKDEGTVTPPPKKGNKAMPMTPMTASKASFSREYYDGDAYALPSQIRSSSSHYTMRPESLSYRASSSSSTTVPDPPDSYAANISRTGISPFVSSSLPKSSGEFSYLKREMSNPGDISEESRPSRLTGPRLQKPRKPSKEDASSMDTASSREPSTPSFGSSLRRKLSLTRRRSVSKTQMAAERDDEIPSKPPQHDDMPPPRLPASATWSGPFVPSPTPSQKHKGSRNVSNSSAVIQQERNRSSTWDSGETPKKAPKSSTTTTTTPRPKRTNRAVLEGTYQQNGTTLKDFLREAKSMEMQLDRDDMSAEEEMKRLASKRKETEDAAKELDALTRRATAKDRVSPTSALRIARLNIFERGEIVDYKNVYFCGTQNAKKHVGDLSEQAGNFGYDDDRGDYNIVTGDHLAYRYEIVDVLGKGSFGQVVRCVDHKTGGLVAIKIIRNKKRFHQQALVEVDILQKLREWVSPRFYAAS